MKRRIVSIDGDQKPKLDRTEKGLFRKITITKTGGSVYHKDKLIG